MHPTCQNFHRLTVGGTGSGRCSEARVTHTPWRSDPRSRSPRGLQNFAKHGYSRDGKSQNVQVIIGVVMVAGWPIAHHVWAGDRVDHSTVQEVISDLRKRFEFGRLIFVGDRGMVTEENIESITKSEQGYLVGIKRRRNAKRDSWLDAVDESKWMDCPGGINAQERKTDPPRTRAQEVATGEPNLRVIVIDSDERRGYEQAKREQAMGRAREVREAQGALGFR
jgi:hypothetical protein